MKAALATAAFACAIVPLTAGAQGGPAIESCVSAASLEFADGDEQAMLETDDAENVLAAVLDRYPVLQRDGFMPSHILLWQRHSGDALYVALLANPEHPDQLCFTATFAARPFDFTRPLMKKYLRLESI